MHQISVSDEVKNKLIELCLIDGKSEDSVLRGLLQCPKNKDQHNKEDFIDATYGICSTKGFMIFRTYKGKLYIARVSKGCWVLDGINKEKGDFYSLNQLSQAVIEGNENAWKFWYFITSDGETKCISELRDPALVKRFQRPKHPNKKNINSFSLLTFTPTKISKTIKTKKPWERE